MKTEMPRYLNGQLMDSTQLGTYPLYYVINEDGDEFFCCPSCARAYEAEESSPGVLSGYLVNYEDVNLLCDNCEKPIPAAYADHFDDDPEPQGRIRRGFRVGAATGGLQSWICYVGGGTRVGLLDAARHLRAMRKERGVI